MNSQPHDLKRIASNAMLARGLVPDFSLAELAETNALHTPAPASGAMRDMRALLWCSIDNDTSRDLDQLSASETLPNGAVKIFVAIADVDALVHRGDALDKHAQLNTTSVYTPAVIFPMLPEKLSTDLTSLGENADRVSIVVEMTVNGDGSLADSDVYQALVRNRAKLAYNSVAAWLRGETPPPAPVAAVPGMDEQIRVQDRVAQQLKSVRHERGALSLETIEASAVFSGDRISDLRVEEKNRAKELIEDFMIAANGVTAEFLKAKGLASFRRIVRSPERWQRIVDVAAKLGEKLPGQPDAAALEAFLEKRKQADPLRFPDLSLTIVKLMGKGEYVVDLPGDEVPGHFGLAVRAYTHSTAPNRRYPDLLTQRLIKCALAGAPPVYGGDELRKLAEHCTAQEDAASKVERQVRKSAAALLLEHSIGQQFDAIVTGVTDKGTWVRAIKPPVEGRLERGYQGLDVGERVRVKLDSVDVERGFIDFSRA
ncbi:MAG TPA: RNB domain-containing ribonuclease [Planctomycetota bacterium]|nr:RNB domain-containing ribonuclease [Planctomycetota bacterium]